MFTYKILNTEEIVTHVEAVIEDGVVVSPAIDYITLKFLTEYTFDNGIIKIIEVSVFNPQNEQYIENSLHNRGVIEENKLD
jgi:hypothetical protein|tara:strand:+ start:1104 stop:1346 length:243 start_codon:yes stop_codon:yes gene_type:complete